MTVFFNREIVSSGADALKRDYVDKRIDYAKAGMGKYWIVDPEETVVTVLSLNDFEYRVAQECRADDVARSLLLDGLTVSVNQSWALAGESPS